MKNIVKSVVLVMMLAQTAMARDILIASATSDVDRVVAQLWLVTDAEGTAKQLKITANDGSAASVYAATNVKQGVVIKKVDSYDVVVIKSNDFEVDRGGHFEMEFLANGITGSKSSKEIEIDFDGEKWQLFHNGRKASRFHFKGRKILGKLVGIKDVVIN